MSSGRRRRRGSSRRRHRSAPRGCRCRPRRVSASTGRPSRSPRTGRRSHRAVVTAAPTGSTWSRGATVCSPSDRARHTRARSPERHHRWTVSRSRRSTIQWTTAPKTAPKTTAKTTAARPPTLATRRRRRSRSRPRGPPRGPPRPAVDVDARARSLAPSRGPEPAEAPGHPLIRGDGGRPPSLDGTQWSTPPGGSAARGPELPRTVAGVLSEEGVCGHYPRGRTSCRTSGGSVVGSAGQQPMPSTTGRADGLRDAAPPLALVVELCDRLRSEGVSYCHWKSNDALDRSASGENDLDLLVDRRSMQAFLGVLAGCGFKQARPPRRRQVPGVLHYYGRDRSTGTLVHVDAQAQLVLGDDTTKNVHLPIEAAYLASCTADELFPVPAPEFELAVLVVRLALKHGTWDAAAFGLGSLRSAERRELEYLYERADQDVLRRVVEEHLPQVGWAAWSTYCRSLRESAPLPARIRAGRQVVRGAAELMRRRPAADTALRCYRRVDWGLRHYALGQRNTKRLAAGGRVLAVVGGDGAGKSTVVRGVADWLQGPLDVRVVHMGKPSRGPATLLVKGAVTAARRTGLVTDWLPNYPTSTQHGNRPPGTAWL